MPPREGPIARQRARNARLTAQAEVIAARDAAQHPADGSADGSVDGSADDNADGSGPPVILLPANTRGTAPLPETSREEFLARLRDAIGVVFAGPVRDNSAPMSLEAAAAREDAMEHTANVLVGHAGPDLAAMLGASCATCRGECCTAGGTHAFLREDSLVRVRAQLEEDGITTTAESLEALYAAHLPERHYRGSCVFHTTSACALPRGLRSNLCNRYLCGGLTQLTRALATTAQHTAYVAAADSVHLRRMTHLSKRGARALALNGSASAPV